MVRLVLSGAVVLGYGGLAKAKADHDAGLGEKKSIYDLTPEEQAELKNVVPVREEYESTGLVVLVGKDIEATLGLRVRMREGLISHGVGTITALLQGDEEDGLCEVVWDSNQLHTRGLHVKMSNKHVCRIGKQGVFDLVLGEDTMCPDLTIVKHKLVISGKPCDHIEVISQCHAPQPVHGLPQVSEADSPAAEDSPVCPDGTCPLPRKSNLATRAADPQQEVLRIAIVSCFFSFLSSRCPLISFFFLLLYVLCNHFKSQVGPEEEEEEEAGEEGAAAGATLPPSRHTHHDRGSHSLVEGQLRSSGSCASDTCDWEKSRRE